MTRSAMSMWLGRAVTRQAGPRGVDLDGLSRVTAMATRMLAPRKSLRRLA